MGNMTMMCDSRGSSLNLLIAWPCECVHSSETYSKIRECLHVHSNMLHGLTNVSVFVLLFFTGDFTGEKDCNIDYVFLID